MPSLLKTNSGYRFPITRKQALEHQPGALSDPAELTRHNGEADVEHDRENRGNGDDGKQPLRYGARYRHSRMAVRRIDCSPN